MTAAPDTDQLLVQAKGGDRNAREELFTSHRGRLRRMVAARLDPRLAARVDPSDVVQETLADADRKLDGYLRDEPLPFFPWLRRLAWERLAKLHEHHVRTGKRAVGRERPPVGVSDESIAEFAEFLSTSASGPVQRLLRAELKARVRSALEKLQERDREVLVMRYLEGLSNAEIAALLDISEPAVRTRHTRALDRLHDLLVEYEEGE
jgi:RNA polymerase sigma-70 factor (ECF subfamily)